MNPYTFRSIVIALFFLAISATSCSTPPVQGSAPALKGNVIVTDRGGIRIHSYISPEDSTLVTSHIVESKNGLVVVDAQFFLPYARELRAYAESLGKPLRRVIVSHAHPDHWVGLTVFADLPIYSLAETQQSIADHGNKRLQALRQNLGALVPQEATVPNQIVVPGSETNDGVRYEYERFADAEGDVHLLIKLPDARTVIVQDLAFNNVHLFLGNNTVRQWIAHLESLQKLEGYDRVLVGHGEPTGVGVYGDNVAYLRTAIPVLEAARNTAELKTPLIGRYPNRRAAGLLDISGLYLYGGQ